MTETKLIVGLGNPGEKYEYTRHNLGFLVLKRLASSQGFTFKKKRDIEGLLSVGEIKENPVVLLMPQTFVNLSGVAVRKAAEQKEIRPENILIVADDLNLSFGQLRFRSQGSDGGHNGLTSIIEHLKTKHFPRLRLGIGRPQEKDQTVDYVLGEFSRTEKQALNTLIEDAVSCIIVWTAEGEHKVMNQFNQRKDNE